jgi:hypothetical protein
MADYLVYEGVRISQTELWEINGKHIAESLAKDSIRECELQYGSPEQRPLISFIMGGVLLMPGILFIQHMFIVLTTEDGRANVRYEGAMFLIGAIGAWLIFQSIFRKRYYLAVTTPTGVRKFVFGRAASLQGIRSFLSGAKSDYALFSSEHLRLASAKR